MISFDSTDGSAETSLSMTIVDRVARAEGADPIALEPLYDAIDPDLLDALPDSDGFSTITFRYHGYTVSVANDDGEFDVTLEEAGIPVGESGNEPVGTGSS